MNGPIYKVGPHWRNSYKRGRVHAERLVDWPTHSPPSTFCGKVIRDTDRGRYIMTDEAITCAACLASIRLERART